MTDRRRRHRAGRTRMLITGASTAAVFGLTASMALNAQAEGPEIAAASVDKTALASDAGSGQVVVIIRRRHTDAGTVTTAPTVTAPPSVRAQPAPRTVQPRPRSRTRGS